MKAPRDDVVAYLDDLLRSATFRDRCPNGLQVYGREQVERVATCPSVSGEFFRQAREGRADLLLVHHGLFWEGGSRVIDPALGARLRQLLEGEMSLVAYHLPLDAHPVLGNSALLAAALGLQNLNFHFGHYQGTPIGCLGETREAVDLEDLADAVAAELGAGPSLFPAGGQAIRRVGVVSGGGGDIPLLLEARQAGCDAYVTGALFEQSVALAHEIGLSVVVLGHYNSEKLGIRALGDALAARFGVEVTHLDVPNPV